VDRLRRGCGEGRMGTSERYPGQISTLRPRARDC
jgi:hypothetical protein